MRLSSNKSPSNYYLSQRFTNYKDINISTKLSPSYKLSKKEIPVKTHLLKKSNLKNISTYLKRLITYTIPLPSKSFVRYSFSRSYNHKIPNYNIKGTFLNYLLSFIRK